MGSAAGTELPDMAIPAGVRAMVEPLCCREKQVQGTAAFLRAVSFAALAQVPDAKADDVIVIHRSVPQLAKAMGLPVAPTKAAAHQRWRNTVYRWVRYLAPLGITAEEAPRAADGRGTGILFHLPAGVAQSVKAAFRALRRFPPGLRWPRWWKELAPPAPRLTTACSNPAVSGIPTTENWGAGACAVDASEPRGRPTAGAAPEATNGTPRVALAAVGTWRANTDRPWKLSRHAAAQIDRYAALLDGIRHPGYAETWLESEIIGFLDREWGATAVIGRAPWDMDRVSPAAGERPRSLGVFARLLRRHYRQLTRGPGGTRQVRASRRADPGAGPDGVDRLPGHDAPQISLGGAEAAVPERALQQDQGAPLTGEFDGKGVA